MNAAVISCSYGRPPDSWLTAIIKCWCCGGFYHSFFRCQNEMRRQEIRTVVVVFQHLQHCQCRQFTDNGRLAANVVTDAFEAVYLEMKITTNTSSNTHTMVQQCMFSLLI